MAIVAHLWTNPSYGRAEAEIFLDQILPHAPDVPVQIPHMAGGGPGFTDSALEVFAEAIQRRDGRTRNLYFDVATVAEDQPVDQLVLLAHRIRQIGVDRVLFGTDTSTPPRPTPRQSWATFRGYVPLTDAEFARIAANVAPIFGSRARASLRVSIGPARAPRCSRAPARRAGSSDPRRRCGR